MENGLGKLWEDRWRIAAWVGPALLAVFFAQQAVLPLAARLEESRLQLASMRENIYEPVWLDSTQSSLRKEVGVLEAFHGSRRSALNGDGSVQVTVDRVRALAQRCGIEVVKTTPALARQDSLRVLKVKIEGLAPYASLMGFFDSLETRHPDLYLEEMLVRRGDRSAGKLESHLVVHVYGGTRGGEP
jgi:hypothetical protein